MNLLLRMWLSFVNCHDTGKALQTPSRVDPAYEYAVKVIKKHEGFRSKPYRFLGKSYKGYGHLILIDSSGVTEQQADSLLRADLNSKLKQIRFRGDRRTKLLLAAYAYNCGNASKLYKFANKPNFKQRYIDCIYANGKVLPSLKQRRIDELKILDI